MAAERRVPTPNPAGPDPGQTLAVIEPGTGQL
jgi:hypothetical protein